MPCMREVIRHTDRGTYVLEILFGLQIEKDIFL